MNKVFEAEPGMVIETGNKIKLTIENETKEYPIYKVDLDLLYYNEYNDRIATWILNYQSKPGAKDFNKMDVTERNKIIEQFIINSNKEKINATKTNIELVSQKVPGVILSDGRVIDGNRRFTCLRQLRNEHPDDANFKYFETVILDLDIKDDKKRIKILELNLQHATDEKVDYDLIDYVIGTYNTIKVDNTLSVAEYARNANEKGSAVQERIELAELINEYLEYIKLPGQYNYLRDKQAYSLFQELLRPLHKCKTEDEAKEFKRMVFANYLSGSFTDVKKFLRDVNNIINTEHYNKMLDEQKAVIDLIEKKKNRATIKLGHDMDQFAKQIADEKDQLKISSDTAFNSYKVSRIKSNPSEMVLGCINNLQSIDRRIFSSLDKEEKKTLLDNLSLLKNTVDKITKDIV